MSDRLIEALRASLENFSQDTRADRTEYARLRAVLVLAIAERDAGPELVTALEAICARIHGDFDHPALAAFGPLLNTEADIMSIASTALARAKGQ